MSRKVARRMRKRWRQKGNDTSRDGSGINTGKNDYEVNVGRRSTPAESYHSGNSKRSNYSKGFRDKDSNGTFSGYNGGYESSGSSFQLDNLPRTSQTTSYSTGSSAPSGTNQVKSSLPGAVTSPQRWSDADQGQFRVKPHSAFPTATYMTESELYQCMMKDSTDFQFLTSYLNPSTKATRRAKVGNLVQRQFGSPKEDGRIGSLRVEILGCVGLDRAKPEISVYAICGDCAFTVDSIQGNRSPMWPNTSRRAAVFPLHHAYARLFIGVFDVKQSKETQADYQCGRVAIDIPSLRPDTEYDITFPLRVSTFIYDRRPRGVVRVRFSLHWFSERSAILSYLKRPRNPLAYSRQAKKFPTIPCGDPKTFRNVAVTVHGQDFPG